MTIPNSLVGAAGEYLVAAELSQKGWLATVTIKNAPGTDVLAQHLATRRVVAIQTKTNRGTSHWILSTRDEYAPSADNEWYVLVRLGGDIGAARFFVLPRSHVSAYLWVGHRRWLLGTKRDGSPRRDSSMRQIFQAELAAYEGRWDCSNAPRVKSIRGCCRSPCWRARAIRASVCRLIILWPPRCLLRDPI